MMNLVSMYESNYEAGIVHVHVVVYLLRLSKRDVCCVCDVCVTCVCVCVCVCVCTCVCCVCVCRVCVEYVLSVCCGCGGSIMMRSRLSELLNSLSKGQHPKDKPL